MKTVPVFASARPSRTRSGNGANTAGPDSAVVLVGAESRSRLLDRLHGIADWLDRRPTPSFGEVVRSLSDQVGPDAVRLALVVGSVDELRQRIGRAAERLGGSACRQIHDPRGIYYFDEPLALEGSLAVLFPGEGAQYPNMLADLLPHFPEVGAHLDRCDRVALARGARTMTVRQAIYGPHASEVNLCRLDNAVSSVLISNWSLFGMLERLGVRADAIAGHSSGEITALASAGCFPADEDLFARLFDLARALQEQEDDAAGTEAVLLAVGAGRKVVAEVLAEVGPDAQIAMDNCPHQVVAAGLPEAMAEVERRLKGRGIVGQRLPFGRPYHTPRFADRLELIARMFDALPIAPPRVPVYSCATGGLFPSDPAEIRRLAVAHWASPVEFVRIIETMYDRGVRIFVESGPRGNLTSFVEDILRGRRFAAVAADHPRRPGLVQWHHLVGILAAHHIPLNLDPSHPIREGEAPAEPRGWGHGLGERGASAPRFAPPTRRDESQRALLDTAHRGADVPRSPSPARQDPDSEQVETTGSAGASASQSLPSRVLLQPVPGAGRTAVLNRYTDVMERFLDLQREVVQEFLALRSRNGVVAIPAVSTSSPTEGPMLIHAEILRHEPGQLLTIRRRVDLGEDLYALDHTLGGRQASAVDPGQNGQPVMPMAFSLELMAEAAARLLPGRLVVGFRTVRLHRWIALDEDPTVLELTARTAPDAPDRVAIAIYDRGPASRPSTVQAPAVEGVVLLGGAYPEPPAPEPFALTNEGPCRFSVEQLYDAERRMFHGPRFQAVASTDRQGDEGIEGHLTTLPHSGLFGSQPDPNLVIDPLLIDASTHLLGAWHLSRVERAGRIVFPFELGAVDFFGPRPAVGQAVKCRVRVGATTSRRVTHRIDLIGPDGRPWCRLDPAEYWRFYWPDCFVDYFRRQDEHLLAQPWPAELGAGGLPARCLRLDPPADLRQPIWQAALARVSLGPPEWAAYQGLAGSADRRIDWLSGRIAAKDAIRSIWLERDGERLFPADLILEPDEHGRPVPRHRDPTRSGLLPSVSIAHSGGVAVAVAAFGTPVGVDFEKVAPRGAGFEELAFDAEERALLDRFGPDRDEAITRFWCAKEALAKALGRGLPEGPRSVVVRWADPATGELALALGPRLAADFPQLAWELLAARTSRDQDEVLAVSFCEVMTP